MNLDALAELTAGKSEAEFRKLYPEPALVFLLATRVEEKASAADPSERTTKIKTDSFKAITKKFSMGETQEGEAPARSYHVGGESNVLFLKKSDRNPFSNMVTVGRSPNNDVWLALGSVSKFHASFSQQRAGWMLTDQKATNETTIDGVALAPGASAPVADGATIGFGPDVRVLFFTPAALFQLVESHRSKSRES